MDLIRFDSIRSIRFTNVLYDSQCFLSFHENQKINKQQTKKLAAMKKAKGGVRPGSWRRW